MHVAIVGAGALGSVYGARLAAAQPAGGIRVSFVVRPSHAEDTHPIVIERVDGDGSVISIDPPQRVTAIPGDTNAVVLCVGVDHLDAALMGSLAATSAPVIVLTPLLPPERDLLLQAVGARLVPGMPGVAAYLHASGRVRYWLPRVAETLLDQSDDPQVSAAVNELAAALSRAGIATRVQPGTFTVNAATTVTFLPLAFALDVAGSARALIADRALFKLALAAAEESKALGRTLGKPAPWADLLVRFLGPTMVKIGLGLAEHASPEAVRFVEGHFGTKMHAQNVLMAAQMVSLAKAAGASHHALEELAARVRAKPSSPPESAAAASRDGSGAQ